MTYRMTREEREAVDSIFIQIGRALSLTIVAAHAKSSVEDEAIAAMDGAWVEVSEQVLSFVEDPDA